MSNYSMSTHTLEFSSSYDALKVVDSTGTMVESFALDNGNESVGVSVASGEYVVEVKDDFDVGRHAIDVGAGDSLSITSAVMAGIGIMDLRDTNRTASFNGDYDLTCTVFCLKYVAGPYALNIGFPSSSTSCFTEE